MYKFILTACLVGLLVPAAIIAQDKPGLTILLFGGAFSPIDDELQSIYGNSFSGQAAIATPIGRYGRIKLAASRLEQSGDPFFRSNDFDAGDAATLTLTGASLTTETDILTPNYPKLYFGVGVDYFFAQERITGSPDSKGNNLGASFSVAPEVRLSDRVLLAAQVSYRFMEMTFKSDRTRYQFNLSGSNIMLGLGYIF